MTWKEAVVSQVGLPSLAAAAKTREEESLTFRLAPITEDALPALRQRAESKYVEEENESGSTYKLVVPQELRRAERRSGPPGVVRRSLVRGGRAYRGFFGILAWISQSISNFSYSLSLIFLLLAVACGISHHQTLSIFALTAIVVLNVVGMGGDIVNLVMISFRKGPLRGVLFLIPPITLFYLFTDWPRYKETVNRMLFPVMMLCLVVVAYMFVPFLNAGQKGADTLRGRVQQAATSIGQDIDESASMASQRVEGAAQELQQQVDRAGAKAKDVGAEVREKLDDLKERNAGAPQPAAGAGAPGNLATPAPGGAP